MLLVLNEKYSLKQYNNLIAWLANKNVSLYHENIGGKRVIAVTGDTSGIDEDMLRSLKIIEKVTEVSEPCKNTNRKFHAEDTIIDVCGHKIGGGHFAMIAGPCSVESEKQIRDIALAVSESGAVFLRGGAFKPRTSPYSFQGMQEKGIALLVMIKSETGMPLVTEISDISQLHLFDEVDIVQVGARNMQNYELLKELGKIKKPILLKRGLANTVEELLMSAEYILAGGNNEVILCERGIRTFENATRNTLDLSAVPLLKEITHLPVIVDPSHATGRRDLVLPMSLAAVAAGADGLMIEVHNNPEQALSDGQQSITPCDFDRLAKAVRQIRPFAYSFEKS